MPDPNTTKSNGGAHKVPLETVALSSEDHTYEDHLLSLVESQDIMKFGMIPEFVGRLPVLASLSHLNEDMLVEILTRPQNALVPQFKALFKMDNVSTYVFKDVQSVIWLLIRCCSMNI